MNNELQQLSTLIGRIYQCATEPVLWNDVLPEVASWVGAPKALLFTPLAVPEKNGFFFNYGYQPSLLELWATHYKQQDIWANRAAEKSLFLEGNVLLGDEVVPREELIETVFYKEFLTRHNTSCILAGVVYGADSPGNMPVTVCSLFRRHEDDLFSPADKERLSILVPHLSRSIGVMFRLRDAELKAAASLATLDRLSVGVLLFNAQGLVSFANTAAVRILDADDGLYLKCKAFSTDPMGELHARYVAESDRITTAIQKSISMNSLEAEHFSRAVTVTRPSGRIPFTLNFSALHPGNEFGRGISAPVAIAFINDASVPIEVDEELLSHTYKLTPAELRAARLLIEGLPTKECALKIGVSEHTLRSQMKTIYQKTGTNNRARLVKLLISLSGAAN